MQISQNTVVTLSYTLSDSDGEKIEEGNEPLMYLHGGYDGIFPKVENELQGKNVGDVLKLKLQPEDAFGEYDSTLVRVEPRSAFPSNLEVGMQFEGGASEDDDDDYVVYTVTDVADDKVVVDGNHPLAGQSLVFECTVVAVRVATAEETTHGHIHGEGGHQH